MIKANDVNTAIDCLKHSIEDTQETIRGYDTKAEILAIILTMAGGITNFTNFPVVTSNNWILFASWILTIVSLGLLGMVLYPKKNQFKSLELGLYVPSEVYFIHDLSSSPQNTVSNLAGKALGTNWVEELMYESMKLSLIRDKKHFWFIWSIRATGVSLFLIFLPIGIKVLYAQ